MQGLIRAMARYPPPLGVLSVLCLVALAAAQSPTIIAPGIQGIPEFVNPGFPVTAYVGVVDPLARLLTFSWTLTNPKGKVVQESESSSFSPFFLIQGTSTLPAQHGDFELTVIISAPRPSDAPGLTSDVADVATASTTFKLTNLPPRKPVIKGFNTASDETSNDAIAEVDGCGFVLALMATAGNEKRPLMTVRDPEGARGMRYIWQIFGTDGNPVLTTRSRTNPLVLFHTGNGDNQDTIPAGTYTARVIVVDNPPVGYTPAYSTADSQQFTVQECPNGYGPFGLNVPAILGAVVSTLPSSALGKLLEPFTMLLPNFGKLGKKKLNKDDPTDGGYGGYYGYGGGYYGGGGYDGGDDGSESGGYDGANSGGYDGANYGGSYDGAYYGGGYDGGSEDPKNHTENHTKTEAGFLSKKLDKVGRLFNHTKPGKSSHGIKDPAGSYGGGYGDDYGGAYYGGAYDGTYGGGYYGYGGDYGGYYGGADPNVTDGKHHNKFGLPDFNLDEFGRLLNFSLPLLGLQSLDIGTILDGIRLGNQAGASGATIDGITSAFAGLPEIGSIPISSNLRVAGSGAPVEIGGPFDSNIINTIIGAVLKDAFPPLSELLEGPFAAFGGPLVELASSALTQLGASAYPALANLGQQGSGSGLGDALNPGSGVGAGLAGAISGGLGDSLAAFGGPALSALGEAALSAIEGALSPANR